MYPLCLLSILSIRSQPQNEMLWQSLGEKAFFHHSTFTWCRLIAEKWVNILWTDPFSSFPLCLIFFFKSPFIHYLASVSLLSHPLFIRSSIYLVFVLPSQSLSILPSMSIRLFILIQPSFCLSLHPPFSVTSLSSFPLTIHTVRLFMRAIFLTVGPSIKWEYERTLGLFRSLKLFSGGHLSAWQTVTLIHTNTVTSPQRPCAHAHIYVVCMFLQDTQ